MDAPQLDGEDLCHFDAQSQTTQSCQQHSVPTRNPRALCPIILESNTYPYRHTPTVFTLNQSVHLIILFLQSYSRSVMRSAEKSWSDTENPGQEELVATDDPIYKQEPWRFVNLTVFVLACLVNSLPAHTFTTINTIVAGLYNIDQVVVSINTLLFPITHPVLAFVANWILDKYGLRIGCSIGMVLLTLGVWLRVLINQSLAPTILGSFLAAAGNIFIINSPSKMAGTWFRPIISPRVTTLGVMANMASIGFGVVLPTLFIDVHSSTKEDVKRMLIYQAIILTVPAVLLIALIRKKPTHPPSFAAGVESKKDYKSDLKTLFKNRNYLLLMLSVAMSYGSLTCFTTCIEFITLPFGFQHPQKMSSFMLVTAMLAGFVSSVIFVMLIKKSLAYKKVLVSAMAGTVVQMLIMMFTFSTHKVWLILVSTGCTGFFFIPQIAIFLQLGCELVFPIGEASSSGFLLAAGQLTGFLTGLLGVSFLKNGEKESSVYVVIGCLCGMVTIGIVSMFFLKQDLRKINYEKSMSETSTRGMGL